MDSVHIPKDQYTLKPRGFVYVIFKNQYSADAAIRKGACKIMGGVSRGYSPLGADVEISEAKQSRSQQKQCQRLFIRGIPPDGNETELLKFFNSVGPVAVHIFPKDRNNGLLRNFCFITFESEALVCSSVRHLAIDGRFAA